MTAAHNARYEFVSVCRLAHTFAIPERDYLELTLAGVGINLLFIDGISFFLCILWILKLG